jgi:signal transduction histidine kinase
VSVPPGVDLSAYRVVQEALTNTVKHAGETTAHVTIRYGAGWLEVAVADEGPARPRAEADGRPPGAGQGLIGMRERVAMLEGEFEAGVAGAGFAVRARFPLEAAGEVR